jgi:predicted Zn-dependent peptidase
MKMNFKKIGISIAWLATFSPLAQATIYLDQELDPLPLFSLQVMLPLGSLSPNPTEAAAFAVLSEIWDDGTERLEKQEYLDALMSYGASVSFGAGRETSSWTLSFPIVEGKNYQPLIELVKENWSQPRFTQESFEKAKVKLDSALKASLDSDMSMAALVGRRWIGIQDFRLYPLLLDGLKNLKLEDVQSVFSDRVIGAPDVWAGYVGPQSHLSLAEHVLKTVFTKQGPIKKGALERPLVQSPHLPSDFQGQKQVIIVEKPTRAQTVFFVMSVFHEFPSSYQKELAFHFGGHILGFSGLGSYFGDEIRNKRGLAYSVSPLQKFYLAKPAVGFLTNPVRERNEEALGVIADLLTAAYEESDIFKILPDDVWDRQWQSFRFGHILDNSSVGARLALRRSVVEGTLSPMLLKSRPNSWSLTREEISNYFREGWSDSSRVIVLVGESKELKPLVEKHFPSYQIKVMGLQETLMQKTYE